MNTWGHEFMWPDEVASEEVYGWLSRETVPDVKEAASLASRQLGGGVDRLSLSPVLMREESEVEARINGHEFPLWVECTSRGVVTNGRFPR